MQIGPVKYSKKEETIFFKSLVAGLLTGLSVGAALDYSLGFPWLPKQLPKDFVSWSGFFLIGIISLVGLCFLTTVIFDFVFCKRARLLNSWRDALRIVWSIFIFFPVLLTYVVLVMSAVFIPLYSATPWLSPAKQYWLGALLLLPFLGLFAAIFLPETPARKGAHRLWLMLKGKAPIPKLNLRSSVIALLIFFWLLLVFLPLPNIALVNLIWIVGGVLVVAYLARQRYQIRRK